MDIGFETDNEVLFNDPKGLGGEVNDATCTEIYREFVNYFFNGGFNIFDNCLIEGREIKDRGLL